MAWRYIVTCQMEDTEMTTMTQTQYDELIAQAQTMGFANPRRWAWNRAASLGMHPELSGIAEPPRSMAERRQSSQDWHDDRTISRRWLSRRA
jgi:hypothetical protein